MSNSWKPRNNNTRNHGGQLVGYVPVGGNYSQKNNTIKFYTRVILKNGKWMPDPTAKFGNWAKPRNGANFVRVANLYGGHMPIKTVHRWSNVNNERRRRNKGVQYDPGLGYNQGNIGN